jgi:O-antigen ligase
LGISLLSAWHGLDVAHSIREIKNKDFYILILVVLVALVRDARTNARLIKIFLGASLAMALWGMIQYAVGVNIIDKADQRFLYLPSALAHWPRPILNLLTLNNGRVLGTRGHPLAYAECLLFSWAFAVAFLVSGHDRRWMSWAMYLVVTGGGLLVSQSRGPWISAALIAGLGAATSSSGRAWILLALGALFAGLFITVPVLRARAMSTFDRSLQSNTERVHMWRAARQIWSSHPVLGIGPGNVKGISERYQTPNERTFGSWGHLHSSYVNCIVERGALGFAAFCLFFGALWHELWNAWRSAPKDSYGASVYQAALLGFIGFLASGATETTYNTAVVMMTFYFVVGLALAQARHKEALRA